MNTSNTPTPPEERWKTFAKEYFQHKVDANEEVWSAEDWFIEGVKYGLDQTYISVSTKKPEKGSACTQDEFKEKYGEYGEKYPPNYNI